MRESLIGMLACAAVVVGAPPAAADPVDDIVGSQMAISHIPGAAVAIVDRGRVVKIASYGMANLEWSAPVGPDTRFQLASATKIFTGVLLMKLVEEGKLSLDDPLTRWFPEAPAAWSEIRVRQLANHTSGLADQLEGTGLDTVEGTVAAAMKAPLAYTPGTEARYGLTDFTVLRAIMEKVSGRTLPELLRQEITGPLGLTNTGFAMANEYGPVRVADIIPKRASVYGWRDGQLSTSDFFFAPQGYGAGGLYSSVSDLARFFASLDAGRVLKRDSITELETPAKLPGGKTSGFGVGWVARKHRGVPVVGHSGGPALSDILRVEDRQLTVIALTNQQVFFPLIAEQIADTMLPAQPPEPAVADDQPALTANVRRAFVSAGKGAVDSQAFAVEGKRASAALADPFNRAMIEGMGPLREVTFLGSSGGERRLRAAFSRKDMVWLATGDAQGRIVRLHPE
jgi:CubicO group peptidase (beta-lactamase class C family)